MNVRPGDTAIIVRPNILFNQDRWVHVVERIYQQDIAGAMCYSVEGRVYFAEPDDGVMWLVESLGAPLIALDYKGRPLGTMIGPCRDKSLRPIRFNDGEDEMIAIAGQAPIPAPVVR